MPEDHERLWWEPDVVVVRVRPAPDVPSPTLALPEDFLGGEFFSQAADTDRRRVRWLLLAVALLLAAGGIALAVVLATRGGKPGASAPAPAGSPAAVTLSLTDFPAGWSVDRSAGAPLRGFLAVAPGGQTADPGGGAGPASVVARQYESCLGVDGAGDALFGLAVSHPVAEVSSPSFRFLQGDGELEAASQTARFTSATPVAQAAREMSDPRFGTCFGAALTQELMAGATEAAQNAAVGGHSGSGSPAAVTFGSPTTTVLPLPQTPGTVAAGVQVSVSFALSGATHQLGIGMVLIDRGQRETTLVTLSGPAGFPPALVTHLTLALEQRLRTTG